MPTPHPIITQLVQLDTLKTWSLIVTLFGDLNGDELTGAQIRLLLGHIGIKPEAIRVALHRLKSDGWITSTKRGREAIYQLSQSARSETAAVAPDVYRKHIKSEDCWEFHLVEDTTEMSDAIQLNRNLALVPMGKKISDVKSLVLTFHGPTLPQWVASSLVPEVVLQLAEKLEKKAKQFSALETNLDKLVFRLLVLHHWRRIALRRGAWAHASFYPRGEIARCHILIVEVLEKTKKMEQNRQCWNSLTSSL